MTISVADFIASRLDETENECADGHGLGCRVYDQRPDPNPDFEVVGDAPADRRNPDLCTCGRRPLLRDVAVTRAIIADWKDPDQVENCWAVDGDGNRYEYTDGRDPDEVESQVAVAWAIDRVLRLIALRWKEHPEYDAAWALG